MIRTRKEVAYDSLREGLRTGRLLPGERLAEVNLSKALQVSRGPLREAINQLASEGLVVQVPGAEDALALLKGMNKMLVAKGKKITEVNLKKDRPDDDELVALMLGPTGNLRAPTMKVGKTVLIGFNEENYTNTLT